MNKLSVSSVILLNAARMEAASLGDGELSPTHLYLGLLRAADLDVLQLVEHGPNENQRDTAEIQRDFAEMIGKLVVDAESPQRLRRKIRRSLKKVGDPLKPEEVHRTTETMVIFAFAAKLAEARGDLVRPADLLAGYTTFKARQPEVPPPLEGEIKDQCPSALTQFGRDLTALARNGKLEPLIGRKEELKQLVRSLGQMRKSNPLLIGEPGVGKTALVEGLAQFIALEAGTAALEVKRLVEISLSQLVAGTKYRGDFESRLNAVIAEAGPDSGVVLFIDELHLLMGAGNSSGAMDAANLLKPPLARGDIRLIGATTDKEFRAHITKDEALLRRFQVIWLNEPTRSEVLELLKSISARLQTHHGIAVRQETLEAAVELSIRYLPDQRLPAKAIDLLDEACATARFATLRPSGNGGAVSVTPEHVAQIIARRCNLPADILCESTGQRVASIRGALLARVKGQDDVINKVAASLSLGALRLKEERKPIGSFLFFGPSGTGKTELAKTISQHLFASEKALIRVDMSEFKEKHSVARLIGAPPGYIGYGEGGRLTEAINRTPACVVLLDEIEKAHPEILDLFLQVLDEGVLTDAQGRRFSFRESVIIMTSNLSVPSVKRRIGFVAPDESFSKPPEGLTKHLRPEFINRVDLIAEFTSLSGQAMFDICNRKLSEIAGRLKKRSIALKWDDSAIDAILSHAKSSEYGARQIDRVINTKVLGPIAEQLAKKSQFGGDMYLRGALGSIDLNFTPRQS
jgi:ATP-dependent Clp protease ATP-binding subunit ClpC